MKLKLVALLLCLFIPMVSAHPTGNMVYTGEVLLWSYVCPVETSEHYGCVMTWNEQQGIKPWLVSEHQASDWMISVNHRNEIYLLERYFDAARQKHIIRLLKGKPFEEPTVLWDWFDDSYRLGEGGFVVLADNQILFARHPHLYIVRQGEQPKRWQSWPNQANRVRLLTNNNLLIQSDDTIWLTSLTGDIQKQWPNLLEPVNADLPFMGNRIFDADYHNSRLWLAYWGQRRFEFIEQDNREVVLKFEPPFLPHAVAVADDNVFVLASSLDPGQAIRPQLWLLEDKALKQIWGANGA